MAEAVDYFTSNQGFARLLSGMMNKYRSLGRWGGSVTLANLNDGEREALEETRDGAIPVLTLCEAIHGGPLLTHAEVLAKAEQGKDTFF